MPQASLTVTQTPRELGEFIITDTSDYTGVTVTSTTLTIVDPTNTSYVVTLYPDNFGTLNGTYTITTTLLSYPSEVFPDGTYSFVLTANLSVGDPLVSPTVYNLQSMNAKVCWANRYEACLKNGNCFSDEEKEVRTDTRELIQAAEEHFAQFRYAAASKALERAVNICEKGSCV